MDWGTWDGIFDNLEDQHLYENPGWVECWILVIPGIPSRMKGVALASGVEIKNTHRRFNMIDTAQSNEHNLDILRVWKLEKHKTEIVAKITFSFHV